MEEYERLGRMQRRNTHSASAISLVVVDVIGWRSLCPPMIWRRVSVNDQLKPARRNETLSTPQHTPVRH